MTKETSLLKLDNVSFSWPSGKKVLDQCNFSMPRKGFWMIVGINGSGKSTLFRLISGMIQPQQGNLLCQLKPALMFQNPDHHLLLPSCGSDLMLSAPHGISKDDLYQRIESALEQVGLEGMFSRPIHTLSGGQKQRLALAGALVSNSDLLLLDEPTALLDPDSQKSILEIVQSLSRRSINPISALWITHRLEELTYCDGGVIMENRKISKLFSSEELLNKLNSLALRHHQG